MSESKKSRRRFLEIATMAIGGAMGAVLTVPIVRYVFFPVRRDIVADAGEPLDVIEATAVKPGAPPVRVQLTASGVRNAWSVADDVALGAAWLSRDSSGKLQALSTACPHLGCAVDFDPQDANYKCPCHKSAFGQAGEKISGPSKRGLDPLPVVEEDGRVKVTLVRYRPDVPRSQAGGAKVKASEPASTRSDKSEAPS